MASDVTQNTEVLKDVLGQKCVILKSGTSVTGGTDYLTLDLKKYGIDRVMAVWGFVHTTDYSIIVPEAVTTSVSTANVLTCTTVLGNDNCRRVVLVFGE